MDNSAANQVGTPLGSGSTGPSKDPGLHIDSGSEGPHGPQNGGSVTIGGAPPPPAPGPGLTARAETASTPSSSGAQTVRFRLAVPKPRPLTVKVSSSTLLDIQLLRLEVHIHNKKGCEFSNVFHDIANRTINSSQEPITLSLGSENLLTILKETQLGNVAEVLVHYSAPHSAVLTISVTEAREENEVVSFFEKLIHHRP